MVLAKPQTKRNLVAQSIARSICLGLQKMTFCLALIEPDRVQEITRQIFDNVSDNLDKLEDQRGFYGALESLEQELKILKFESIQEDYRKLQRQSLEKDEVLRQTEERQKLIEERLEFERVERERLANEA